MTESTKGFSAKVYLCSYFFSDPVSAISLHMQSDVILPLHQDTHYSTHSSETLNVFTVRSKYLAYNYLLGVTHMVIHVGVILLNGVKRWSGFSVDRSPRRRIRQIPDFFRAIVTHINSCSVGRVGREGLGVGRLRQKGRGD